MDSYRETVEGLKRNMGVSEAEAEAERIFNHFTSYEEYPSDCTIIEKEIFEDRNGDTFVRLTRAHGRGSVFTRYPPPKRRKIK